MGPFLFTRKIRTEIDMKKITRREYLSTTLGAGAALATFSKQTATAADTNKLPWIDAHVHIWTGDRKKYPIAKSFASHVIEPPTFTPEELFAECRPQGVGRIVLVQMSFYQYDNSYMLDAMKSQPGVFGGIAIVDPESPGLTAEMENLQKLGVRGYRLYAGKEKAEAWPESTGICKQWETAAKLRQAICCLANPDALPAIEKMCRAYPKTTVVIDHFARIGVSGQVIEKELDKLVALAKHPQVYVKTSAFYALGKKKPPHTDLGPMIRRLRDSYGANRLMWASDCPYQVVKGNTYADSISLIRDKLDFLSKEDKDWMLRGTAEKLFFT